MNEKYNVYLVSDSTGETLDRIFLSLKSQFANFQYEKGNDKASFTETFTDDATQHVRQNEHTLYMEKQANILSKAKKVGFILEGKIEMTEVQYEYQYLYFLQKPE